ncbi:MAG: DUF3152 domain-containing protein [Nitriliruptorales bacterium]|nr:DUF3152 domain-containing protein [Nitriliruptorales bacterium]
MMLLTGMVTALILHPEHVSVAQETGGTAGPAVFRKGHWYLRESLDGGTASTSFKYGVATDMPVFGDWNGVEGQTPGVFRDGTWHLDNDYEGGSADITVDYGLATDTPVAGDWDGDGHDEIGVVRGRTWFLDSDLDGDSDFKFVFGREGDVPLVGDWNGDGVSTPGVRRGATFYLDDDLGGGEAEHVFRYGLTADLPVVGRWSQAAADRVGVVRGREWFLRFELAGGNADLSFFYGTEEDVFLAWRAPAEAELTYYYSVGREGQPNGDLSRFAEVASRALSDDRGWSLNGDIAFTRVSDPDDADFHLWLTDDDDVGEKAETCSDTWSCTVGDDLYINDDNWNNSTSTWDHRPLYDYRRYVINHEVGHWLGLDHFNDSDDCDANDDAPVMMQQSIDLHGCETNLWPLPFEQELVAERRLN